MAQPARRPKQKRNARVLRIGIPAGRAKELGAVEEGAQSNHAGAAAIAEFVGFARVELDGDPDGAVAFLDQAKDGGDVFLDIIENPCSRAVLGELPMRCGAGQVLTVLIHDENLDYVGLVHRNAGAGSRAVFAAAQHLVSESTEFSML
jgi:hypothetical protein